MDREQQIDALLKCMMDKNMTREQAARLIDESDRLAGLHKARKPEPRGWEYEHKTDGMRVVLMNKSDLPWEDYKVTPLYSIKQLEEMMLPEWMTTFMREYRLAPMDWDTLANLFQDAHKERVELRETVASLNRQIAEMRKPQPQGYLDIEFGD